MIVVGQALVYLPSAKIGVVVLCNQDIANGRTQRLANLALSLMIEAKTGEQPPADSKTFSAVLSVPQHTPRQRAGLTEDAPCDPGRVIRRPVVDND